MTGENRKKICVALALLATLFLVVVVVTVVLVVIYETGMHLANEKIPTSTNSSKYRVGHEVDPRSCANFH